MEIKDYKDLTEFISDESLKVQENLGAHKVSTKMLKFTEDNLMKYVKLYDGPLYRREKRQLALQEAIETMPHGFFWKIFHWSLWQKIKSLQNAEKQKAKVIKKKKCKPSVQFPEVVKPVSLPQEFNESEEE